MCVQLTIKGCQRQLQFTCRQHYLMVTFLPTDYYFPFALKITLVCIYIPPIGWKQRSLFDVSMGKPSKVSRKRMKTSESILIFLCAITSAFAFAVGAGSDDPEDFRKMTAGARKKCIAETKTTLKAVEDFEYGVMPDDDNLKCYFKCVLEKFGMMDKTGKIKYNQLKKVIPQAYKELAYEMIDSCVDPPGKDNCEKAFNFMKCMYNENPMAFIAP